MLLYMLGEGLLVGESKLGVVGVVNRKKWGDCDVCRGSWGGLPEF